MLFEKEALTTEQLIDKLIDRGMIIGDRDFASKILNAVNYYRLATYWYEFRITNPDGSHGFKPGVTLERVVEIYNFDCDLRVHVFRAIEEFEVAFRRVFASHIATKYDPFAHLNPTLMKNRDKWAKTVARIHAEYQASHEEFARHNIEKYGEYFLPPIWVTVELTTLGGLRHFYQNWGNRMDRQSIASEFGMEEPVFDSWLEHLETVRNVCAHHSRLWNRRFARKPKLPNNLVFKISSELNRDQRLLPNIYNTLVLLDYVNSISVSGGDLLNKVAERLEVSPSINPRKLGFPD